MATNEDAIKNQVGDLQTRVRVLDEKITAIQDDIPEWPDYYFDMAYSFFAGN